MDKYKVTLSVEEREELERMISKGKAAARKLAHARVLLLADESDGRTPKTDAEIAEFLQVGLRTIGRVRQRFVTESCKEAVSPRRQPPRPDKIKIQGDIEQQLIELACSEPPEGRWCWTLQLLADRLVMLTRLDTVGRETIRLALKKMTFSPGW